MANRSRLENLASQMLPLAQRHLIHRPRLTRLLDDAKGRILVLAAPAGYGKTTLAHEWTSARGRRALWLRGRTGVADVATLARALSTALAPVAPGIERSIRELLKTMNTPEEEAATIADMFVEELDDWPHGTWLVVDEYELLAPHAASVKLVERFVEGSTARVMITTRELPAWIGPRDRLYGDVFELGRAALSMSADEVAQVLADAPHATDELIALADGWPAVIGLAALLPSEIRPTTDAQSALFDYVAQELFDSLDADVRHHLPLLALPSTLTHVTVRATAGDASERVLRDSVRVGLMTVRNGTETEIHPLCRAFLTRKLVESGLANGRLTALTDHLIEAEQWDDAFDVICRFRLTEHLRLLLRSALRSVLAEGRLATVERWAETASELGLEAPEVTLARAEIYLRHGNWQLSETLAASCAPLLDSPYLAAQAYLCAGSAAHLVEFYDRSDNYFASALDRDNSSETRRRALWGRFLANLHTESREPYLKALAELEQAADATPEHIMRIQQAKLLIADRDGGLLEAAETALAVEPLLAHVEDPFVRSGFMNVLADALNCSAHYAAAERIAELEILESERFKLKFVLPYALFNLAGAKLGAGAYSAASALVDRSEQADVTRDPFLAAKRITARARLFLARGDAERAMLMLRPSNFESVRWDVASEVVATRAIAEACAGEFMTCALTLRDVGASRTHVGAQALAAAAQAILALRSEQPLEALLTDFARAVRHSGHYDSVLTTTRAYPALLDACVEDLEARPLIQRTASLTGDPTLVSALGERPLPSRTGAALSTRELEVLALAAQFRNKEIASRLFISEKTVKTHLQNTYAKLGVHSRTEAVVKAKEAGLLR